MYIYMRNVNSAILKFGEEGACGQCLVITVNRYDNFIYQLLLRRLLIIEIQ